MISKSEQLEQLFVKWELAQENEPDSSWQLTKGGNNITKSHFRRDGIIDEAIFAKEKEKRCLFQMKPMMMNTLPKRTQSQTMLTIIGDIMRWVTMIGLVK